MQKDWNNEQPIYRQIRDRVAALILDGSYHEGESIPSVRQVSSESKVNHLTVAKAYQELVDEGVLEMRRGRGMFVLDGAQQALLEQERKKFLEQELPALIERLRSLGISPQDLHEWIQKNDQ